MGYVQVTIVRLLKDDDDELYLSLALQTILHDKVKATGLKHHEIKGIVEEVQEERELFREAAHAIRHPSGKVIPQMRFILAHLQDDHLASSFLEARSLDLDTEFIHMLRSEIMRRGITELSYEEFED